MNWWLRKTLMGLELEVDVARTTGSGCASGMPVVVLVPQDGQNLRPLSHLIQSTLYYRQEPIIGTTAQNQEQLNYNKHQAKHVYFLVNRKDDRKNHLLPDQKENYLSCDRP